MIRRIRIIIAVIVLLMFTLLFLDFRGIIPSWLSFFPDIQFVPAVVSGSFIVLGAIVLLTLLFGRIYCSVLCPLGILQDIPEWLARRFGKRKYKYEPPKYLLRWLIVILCTTTILSGIILPVSVLDPYSAFGRIVTTFFSPVFILLNNGLEKLFTSFGNYSFYKVEIIIPNLITFIIAAVTSLTVILMSALFGRKYCNSICPVGTILGLLSTKSLFSIKINDQGCTGCGKCEKVCKASCIDSKNAKIDRQRCVVCFNCLSQCNKEALVYAGKPEPIKVNSPFGKAVIPGEKPATVFSDSIVPNKERRDFLSGIMALGVLPLVVTSDKLYILEGGLSYKKEFPITPPGSVCANDFHRKCTACQLCVAKCPANILRPAYKEYGWKGIMQPIVDFEKGFCNYDCTICTEICPTHALEKLTVEEKHQTQIGRVVFIKENCIVHTDETSCGACSEHCPTQAVAMVPYKAGLTIPEIDPDICVGCGGCEFICPVRPYRAIYVNGNPIHLKAEKFTDTRSEETGDLDFGF